MSWFKLLTHDLYCGLLRWRYLAVFLLFTMPCFLFSTLLRHVELSGSWMDYMLFLFQGKAPISNIELNERIELPILWLLTVGSCLLVNLDYLIMDLTNFGQQVIIRCKHRTSWYLSKCFWNLTSCLLYFLSAAITCCVFCLATGADVSMQNTASISMIILGYVLNEELTLLPVHGILVTCVIPYLTIAAFNILQMTLCLITKPIISFIICISLLILSVYWNSPFVLGNGAMVIRSDLISTNGISPIAALILSVVVICTSIVVGICRFRHIDILGFEE